MTERMSTLSALESINFLHDDYYNAADMKMPAVAVSGVVVVEAHCLLCLAVFHLMLSSHEVRGWRVKTLSISIIQANKQNARS